MRKTSTHSDPSITLHWRVGIHIKYRPNLIRKPDLTKPLKPHYLFRYECSHTDALSRYSRGIVTSLLHVPGLKAVVMKTFGSGNAPQREWFIRQLKEATERGLSSSTSPNVLRELWKWDATRRECIFWKPVSSADMTALPDIAITKLMFLLGHGLSNQDIRNKMNSCLIGEITKP